MRMWWLHFGQTCRFDSRSERYSTASHDGHLTHRPSGMVWRFAASERWIRGGSSFSNQLMCSPSQQSEIGRSLAVRIRLVEFLLASPCLLDKLEMQASRGFRHSNQFEVQGDAFEVVVQRVLRQAADVHFLELARTGESLAAPHRIGNVAEADLLDLGRADQAAQALFQVIYPDHIANPV